MMNLKDLRLWLKLDPKQDERLQFLRDGTCALWESETSKVWIDPDPTEASSPFFDKLVETPDFEITGPIILSAVNVRNVVVTAWDKAQDESEADILVLNTDYRLRLRSSLRKAGGYWRIDMIPSGSFQFLKYWTRITYDAGYRLDVLATDPQALPTKLVADITLANMLQAEYTSKRNSGDKAIQETQGFEGGSTKYRKGSLHPDFEKAIKLHKMKVPC